MPRYFFHVADRDRVVDQVGDELPGNDAARKMAIIFLGEILRDEPDRPWDGCDFRVEVTNEQHELLFTVISLAVDAPAASMSG